MLKRSSSLLLAWLLSLFAWSASVGEIGLANAQECAPDSVVARAVQPIANVARATGIGRLRCSPSGPPSALAERQLEKLGATTGYVPVAFVPEDGTKPEIVATWLSGKKVVDSEGRVYPDWDAYVAENQLDAGKIVYPRGGNPANCPGSFDGSYTPAKKVGSKFAALTDSVTTVGSVVTLAAAFFGVSGYGWAAAGVIMTGWGLYRSVQVIVDRVRHRQTLDPRHSPSARSAILQTLAAAFGLGGSAADVSAAFVGLAEKLAALSNGTTIINAVDGLLHLLQHWREYSSEEKLKTLFWIAGGGDDTRAEAPDEVPSDAAPDLTP